MYILIPGIKCVDVNFEHNFLVSGDYPSVPSLVGWVHAAFRRMPGLQENSILPIFHETARNMSIMLPVPSLDNLRQNKAASTIETMTGRATFSLLIQASGAGEAAEIHKGFNGLRLSGGTVFLPQADAIRIFDTHAECLLGMKQMPPGFVLADRTERLFEEGTDDDKMTALLNIVGTEYVKKDNGKFGVASEAREGWMMPIAIGYAALEELVLRDGRNGEGLHCYVEPVAGLGERLFFSRHNAQDVFSQPVFWGYDVNQDNGTYLYSGRTL